MLDKLQIPKDTPYWWDTVEDKYYPKFSPSTSKSIVDFVVIGAGFTGLSAAYTLAKAGKSVVCVDQNQPGFGASTRNGGMIGSGHKVSYETATRLYGAEAAQQLVSEGLSSVEHTVDLIKHLKIDCDYQHEESDEHLSHKFFLINAISQFLSRQLVVDTEQGVT